MLLIISDSGLLQPCWPCFTHERQRNSGNRSKVGDWIACKHYYDQSISIIDVLPRLNALSRKTPA